MDSRGRIGPDVRDGLVQIHRVAVADEQRKSCGSTTRGGRAIALGRDDRSSAVLFGPTTPETISLNSNAKAIQQPRLNSGRSIESQSIAR